MHSASYLPLPSCRSSCTTLHLYLFIAAIISSGHPCHELHHTESNLIPHSAHHPMYCMWILSTPVFWYRCFYLLFKHESHFDNKLFQLMFIPSFPQRLEGMEIPSPVSWAWWFAAEVTNGDVRWMQGWRYISAKWQLPHPGATCLD